MIHFPGEESLLQNARCFGEGPELALGRDRKTTQESCALPECNVKTRKIDVVVLPLPSAPLRGSRVARRSRKKRSPLAP